MSTMQQCFERLRVMMASDGGDRGVYDSRLNIVEAISAFQRNYRYSITPEMSAEIDQCHALVWYRQHAEEGAQQRTLL